MGRKCKLTPEIQGRIVTAIAAGNYAAVAAQYGGIGQSTFYRYLEEGERQQEGAKRDFWEAVKNAEAQAEAASVAIIRKAAHDSWQAAAWWLERKFADRWGRKAMTATVGIETSAGGGARLLLQLGEGPPRIVDLTDTDLSRFSEQELEALRDMRAFEGDDPRRLAGPPARGGGE